MKCGDFTLLFAVDHFETKESYIKAFSEEGYRVLTCDNAVEVLFALSLTKIDLLVTDLKLPQANSVDVLPLLKQKYPQLPVIVVSAYYQQIEDRYRGQEHTVKLFLNKPTQMSFLKAKIRELLKIAPIV